jgi:thioredoxin reductase
MPVSLETFTRYAMSFQRELVPDVEDVMVSRVDTSRDGFTLKLENGETLQATNVIVATGLEHTVYVPPIIRYLPQALRSHSSEHRDLSRFAGKDVTLIGGGQSSLETAALLRETGAQVRIIVRRPAVEWNDPPRLKRSLYHKLRFPLSYLGEGMQVWFYGKAPTLFGCLPLKIRASKINTVLSASGACWLRSRVEGTIETLTSRFITNASVQDGRVALKVADREGNLLTIMTDHVIAATGYHYDLHKLPFLSDRLKERLQTEDKRPRLNRDYESTVPHLYFTGIASAYRFGPSMRFIAGVGHAARVISGHIAPRQQQAAPQETRVAAASASR